MQALLKRDFHLFFSKQNRLFLLPIVCLFLLGCMNQFLGFTPVQIFETLMGIRTQNLQNPLLFSSYFILWGYYIWYALFSYYYDYKYSPEFILKRISPSKLMQQKILSIAIFTVISQVILNIVILLAFGINGITVSLPNLLYSNLFLWLIRYTMQMFFLLMFALFHHYGYLFIIAFLLLPVLQIVQIDVMSFVLNNKDGWFFWMITGIVLTLILYRYSKKNILKFIERGD